MHELTLFAGVTVVYTALAMWATQPSFACVMREEPRRHLYLERPLDLEHLTRDAHRIRQLARRSVAHAPAPDADARIALCERSLAREVAAVHDLPLDRVQASMPVER